MQVPSQEESLPQDFVSLRFRAVQRGEHFPIPGPRVATEGNQWNLYMMSGLVLNSQETSFCPTWLGVLGKMVAWFRRQVGG